MLTVENLSVRFKTRSGVVDAVRDVSLTAQAGETLGVVGESGSGKSVTAYSVLRILERTGEIAAGKIAFNGTNLLDATPDEIRHIRGRDIAMIFQNPQTALNPIRAVGRQIEDVLMEHLKLSLKDARSRAIELLDLVRIQRPEERYHAYPFELSGGMCQRVMIAIAMACNPELLIADEPTTGLDVTTQKVVMDMIAELSRSRNMGTILITHDLGLASRYCDRIVVMQNGRVVETGDTTNLFRTPQHRYTKQLIAATPRKFSRLHDLLPPDDGSYDRLRVVKDLARIERGAVETQKNVEPLLRTFNLLKEFSVGGAQTWVNRSLDRILRNPAMPNGRTLKAVDDVSFSIWKGESVGLVGESGCGKTTTSRMIARLINPTDGSIRFLGEDIAKISARSFTKSTHRAKIQMVFQDPTGSLNPRATAFDSIADPLRRLGRLTNRTELRDRVADLAAKAGLQNDLLPRFPHQLSGGQKARVGIARAIALNPELLILDEPTSALDVSVQAIVLNQLNYLRYELGLSFLFISHDLNVVRLMCDRVIVMNSGRIIEQGASEDVLERPKDAYTKSLIGAIPHLPLDDRRPGSNTASTGPL